MASTYLSMLQYVCTSGPKLLKFVHAQEKDQNFEWEDLDFSVSTNYLLS